MRLSSLALLFSLVAVFASEPYENEQKFNNHQQSRDDVMRRPNLRSLHRKSRKEDFADQMHYGRSHHHHSTEKGHLRGEDPYEESIRFHRQRDAGEEEENPKLILQSKKCKKFMREVDDKVKKYNDFSVDDMVKFFCNPARVESMAKKVQECAKKQAAKEKDSCAKAYEQMVGNTKNQVIHALHSKKSCEEEVRREMAYVKATSKKKAGWRDKAHGLVKGVKGSLSKGLDNAKGTFSTGLNKMKNMFGGSGGEDGKDNA